MTPAPFVLWVMWFGPMGPTRRQSLERITRSAHVNVVLLTDKNFTSVGSDLHPVATSGVLSKNHLSDYLRAYVMHHYGGAYQDVKPTQINWREQIERLNANKSSWFVGSEELPYFKKHPAWDKSFGERGILPPYSSIASQGANCVTSNGYYAAKPNTPLTTTWLDLVSRKLDEHARALFAHPPPYHRCCFPPQKANGYPLYWTELHGNLLHPLQVTYCHAITTFYKIFVRNYRDGIEDTSHTAGVRPPGAA
jgi:hypothetical protein